ncbi:MAG: TolB family protein, partial [Planctomycetota bacterium]
MHAHLLRIWLIVALLAPVDFVGAGPVPRYDAATFYDTTSLFGASFSPDETKLLLTSDETGIFNAYVVPVDGGERTPITRSQGDAIFGISFFPRDERVLYTADQGGNELNHLYVREIDGGSRDLTPGEGLKASFAGWSHDDRSFYVTSNERDKRFMDLYRYDVDSYERQLVFRNDGGFMVGPRSRDGRWHVLVKTRNNADNDLYLWDATRPEEAPRHISPHEGNIAHAPATFTPDSAALLFTSNEDSEFNRIWAYDLQSGEKSVMAEAAWDIMYASYSWDGRYLTMGINTDARTELRVRDLERNAPVRLPALPQGDITGVSFSRSGRTMAFYVNGDRSPSNLFVLDMASGRSRQLTETLNPKMKAEHLVESTVVRYRSFDGL